MKNTVKRSDQTANTTAPARKASFRTVKINASRPYSVRIGAGLLDRSGECLARLFKSSGCKRLLLVSDQTVDAYWGDQCAKSLCDAGFEVTRYTFPSGEQSKSFDTLSELLEVAAEVPLTRSDAFVALGGGVVGDLTGFAASIYLRGIPYVQIPTTLLAAVDSSVGGKTAIDLDAGKNLAGCFWQPSIVLCDPNTLSTLPPEQFREGCAEVIKYGMIGDPVLLRKLERDGPDFNREEVIAACVRDKRKAVEADELDTGVRRLLNFGHTVGHAIERLSRYTFTHGQAVAVGMAIMARASAASGICSRSIPANLERTLVRFGLPISLPPKQMRYTAEVLADAALNDKKRVGDQIALVLPVAHGRCDIFMYPVSELTSFIEKGV